MQLACMQQRSV